MPCPDNTRQTRLFPSMFWMDIKEDGNPLQGFGDPQATGGQFRLCAQTIGSLYSRSELAELAGKQGSLVTIILLFLKRYEVVMPAPALHCLHFAARVAANCCRHSNWGQGSRCVQRSY